MIMALDDILQELVASKWGRGAAVSLDPHREGWAARAWNAKGLEMEIAYGVTKSEARLRLARELRKGEGVNDE